MLEDFLSHRYNTPLMIRRDHNDIRECKLTIRFIALMVNVQRRVNYLPNKKKGLVTCGSSALHSYVIKPRVPKSNCQKDMTLLLPNNDTN